MCQKKQMNQKKRIITFVQNLGHKILHKLM